ncbi:hypothetical protein CC85DRAFT_302723 [Cutaneotrichosporon oleaginosum]|uniref:F-box domain-containing protein n=1 Tax=Cutaneotrichosporon oleaginosum TaxID=879819 RepID=A0A0J0XLM6_9TREE|nr:uncharacterized protein CC85DRAFT_302723 [Cutaneotrichosporon oleaginosum]KLT42001.1 hypothetical protein CC85DRAFT_302723 [Cutaneotrichosporon oleaginosum]
MTRRMREAARGPPALASLEGLPDDVLVHIFELLDAEDLVRLRVSRTLDSRVRTLGIPLHLSQHPVSHQTLHPAPPRWPPAALFALNGRISRALQTHKLHALQIGPEWRSPVIPALCLRGGDDPALVLGVGTQLLVHPLAARRMWAPRSAAPAHAMSLGGSSSASGSMSGSGSAADIVGIHALAAPDSFVVAHFDGTLRRLSRAACTAHYMHPRGGVSSPANIRAFAGCGDAFLAASERRVRLYSARAPWTPPAEIALSARPWSAALAGDTAYLGVAGAIGMYALSGAVPAGTLRGPAKSEAYAVVPARQVLSAWYDGVARIHDPRAGAAPVIALADPWSDAALYSAAYVGEYGVAAGGALHGAVSVWDVRNPAAGWSVFSPAGRGSPVYALAGDGGRVWGVTERRAFTGL